MEIYSEEHEREMEKAYLEIEFLKKKLAAAHHEIAELEERVNYLTGQLDGLYLE